MNTAQSYNAEGQRIEVETLYSPFLRLLHVPKRSERKADFAVPEPKKKKWPEVILAALEQGPCNASDLWERCKHKKGTKASFSTYLSEMAVDGRVERIGKKQPYFYGLKSD